MKLAGFSNRTLLADGTEKVTPVAKMAIAFMEAPDLELTDSDEEEVETFEKIRSNRMGWKEWQAAKAKRRSK